MGSPPFQLGHRIRGNEDYYIRLFNLTTMINHRILIKILSVAGFTKKNYAINQIKYKDKNKSNKFGFQKPRILFLTFSWHIYLSDIYKIVFKIIFKDICQCNIDIYHSFSFCAYIAAPNIGTFSEQLCWFSFDKI